jgi:ABC-2 type transport system permease protein
MTTSVAQSDIAATGGAAPKQPARSWTYLKVELIRTRRSRRRVLFTLVLPVVFYLIFSASSKTHVGGISFAAYYMVSMATYSTFNALFAAGSLIALERAAGWNRQLRLTGLRGYQYVMAKVVAAYATAAPGVLLVFILGATTRHVSLSAGSWIGAGGSILLSAIPLAVVGVLAGYLARPEVVQPLLGIGSAFLAIIGGIWFPITGGVILVIAKCLPPYWIASAGRAVIAGTWLGWTGTAVLTGWTVVLIALAGWAYRKDTLRA